MNLRPAPMVLAAHDLSCAGRCALTVAVPALAAAGLQPIPLPTAVLSTHTGGFSGMASRVLTDFMRETVAHWDLLGLRFDAIYTGYLADPAQGEVLINFIADQRRFGLPFVLVDPAMGDDGALYSGLDPATPRVMAELCREADLITPNLTEAALLAGADPGEALHSISEAEALIGRMGAKAYVVTGAKLADGRHFNILPGAAVEYDACPGIYPGAGDLFSSVLLGRLMRGQALRPAVEFATRFCERVVRDTCDMGCEARMGLQFERRLGELGGN